MTLFIFDLDGTLADRGSTDLYPPAREWLESQSGKNHRYAIATNQGGVGWRYWLESDPPRWAVERGISLSLQGLLQEHSTWMRVHNVARIVSDIVSAPCSMYICYAYITRKGERGPVPPGKGDTPEWLFSRRKPAPGMLFAAMSENRVSPLDTIMVGDRDEDWFAAKEAGCGFMWPYEIFGEQQ